MQSFLRCNYQLLKSYGIIYLNQDKHPAFFSLPFDSYNNHKQFSFVSADINSLLSYLRHQRDANLNHNFIISSEYFSSRISSCADLAKIKHFLEEIFTTVIIVGYIRSPCDLINSSILELIKSGELSYSNYSKLHEYQGFMNVLAFSNIFKYWSSLFSNSRLIKYEIYSHHSSCLYAPLLDPILDPPILTSFIDTCLDVPVANRRISKGQARFLLSMNTFLRGLYSVVPSSVKHYSSRLLLKISLLLFHDTSNYEYHFSPGYYQFLLALATERQLNK